MKILCIGDQHFKVSNIPNVNIFMKNLKQFLDEEKMDVIVSMGDLLDTHERLHTEPLNKAVEYLNILSTYRKTYVLVGNHDKINNSQFLTDKHWLNCCKNNDNLVVVDTVVISSFESNKLVFCPYVPDGGFIASLNTRKGEWEDATCIFAHQLFDGAKMGAIVAEGVEKWPADYPQVVSGHIHDKQWVQENLYYTGSSMQHAFGESHDKTILVLDIEENEITKDSFIEVDLHLPKKKIIHLDMEDLDDFDVDKLNDDTDYKLTINGNQEDFESFKKTTKYKTLSKLVKIIFKHKRSHVTQQMEYINKTLDKPDDQKTFNKILQELVEQEDDKSLETMFYNIVYEQQKEDPNEDCIELDIEEEHDEEVCCK